MEVNLICSKSGAAPMAGTTIPHFGIDRKVISQSFNKLVLKDEIKFDKF